MHDPLPLRNPPWLQKLAQPVADVTGLASLPAHIHEILFAFAIYHFTLSTVSPLVSRFFFGEQFTRLSPRTQFNWHVHAVALVQSVVICGLALWVRQVDEELPLMNWQERVFGYTGGAGLVQAFAAGYFLWDLYICARYFKLFGFGMLAHALAANCVYLLGFRPFVNGYSASFVLYELSSPFLNVHWFCDKLGWTGGNLQFINGVILLVTFAGCRLVYGTYITFHLLYDIWTSVSYANEHPHTPPFAVSPFALEATKEFNNPTAALEVVSYAPKSAHIPFWLWFSNLASAMTLVVLNFYWYSLMVSAIRKRFDPPFGTRRKEKGEGEVNVTRGIDAQGRSTVTASTLQVKRRAPLRMESSDIPPPTT